MAPSADEQRDVNSALMKTYDLPIGNDFLQKYAILKYVPFLPGFKSKSERSAVAPETKLDKERESFV